MLLATFIIAAYLLGSVNIAILIFQWTGKDDPRKHFSGNTGTTNVYRQAGGLWAAMVLLFDLGRALLLSAAALYWLPIGFVPWVALALVIGNRFPCFHQFRGGKGVASYLGFALPIAPLYAALAAGVWVTAFGIVRIPFIASFCMIAVLTVGIVVACDVQAIATAGALTTACFILYNHRQNILGLRARLSQS